MAWDPRCLFQTIKCQPIRGIVKPDSRRLAPYLFPSIQPLEKPLLEIFHSIIRELREFLLQDRFQGTTQKKVDTSFGRVIPLLSKLATNTHTVYSNTFILR